MDSQGMLDRALAALHDTALDETLWPHASALIDDACGATGNALVASETFGNESRIHFRACYYRGARNEELEQYYFRNYHHRDERVPRLRQLPDGLLVHTPDLYTDREKQTSAAYNEALSRTGDRNGLAVRLDGPNGTSISWVFADPSQPGGWGSRHIEMIECLLPHVRQFVQVRHALTRAHSFNSSIIGLLDNDRVGVIHLDQNGRILEANDRALEILRRGGAVYDRKGTLGAWFPADNTRLQRLLAGALPPLDGQAAAGSMTVRRLGDACRLMLHINPVKGPALDFGARRVAALVLLTEPRRRPWRRTVRA